MDKISTDISTDTSAVRVSISMSEDSGGAVMGRGGRSGDVQRLENFFQSARDWGMQEDRQEQPLQQNQFESEGEAGDHDDDDNQPLHSSQFGNNSPAKGAGNKKGGTTSTVWSVIKEECALTKVMRWYIYGKTRVHRRLSRTSSNRCACRFRFRFSVQ